LGVPLFSGTLYMFGTLGGLLHLVQQRGAWAGCGQCIKHTSSQ